MSKPKLTEFINKEDREGVKGWTYIIHALNPVEGWGKGSQADIKLRLSKTIGRLEDVRASFVDYLRLPNEGKQSPYFRSKS